MQSYWEKIALASVLLIVGYALTWFQSSSQFVWNYWEDKQIQIVLLLSIPCGLLFIYATKLAYEATGSLWTVRFLAFSLSNLSFPVLTWVFLKESPLTYKTITCFILCICILLVQLYGD